MKFVRLFLCTNPLLKVPIFSKLTTVPCLSTLLVIVPPLLILPALPEFVKEVMIPLSALTKVPMFLVLLRVLMVPALVADRVPVLAIEAMFPLF